MEDITPRIEIGVDGFALAAARMPVCIYAFETLQILENIKSRYEDHHHVNYTDDALKACVKLTDRYITDRFFPDKAIDAMDEVGSRVHLQFAKVPPEITELEKNINEWKHIVLFISHDETLIERTANMGKGTKKSSSKKMSRKQRKKQR